MAPTQAPPPPAPSRLSEATTVHTRILRCTLAVEDCAAYWQNVDRSVRPADRARVAFEQRWFGVKSEARVRTIMADMLARFDAYPEALALLHELAAEAPLPARLRPFVCHVHTQLADPIYRQFTGDYLATRRTQGLRTVDLESVARWVEELHPGRWSPTTRTKFASNLLATALDVGLVGSGRDPRPLTLAAPPEVFVGYLLHLLRSVAHQGTQLDNPYLRSLGIDAGSFGAIVARVPGLRFARLGSVTELTFEEPSLRAWARAHLLPLGVAS